MEAFKSSRKTQNKHSLLVCVLLLAAAWHQKTLATSRQRKTQMPRAGYRIYGNARQQHHGAARLVQRRPSVILSTGVTSVLSKFPTYIQVANSAASAANRKVDYTKSYVLPSISPGATFQKSSLRRFFEQRNMSRKAGRKLSKSQSLLSSNSSWFGRVSQAQTLARRRRLKFHQPLYIRSRHQRLEHKRSRYYPYGLWRLRQKIGKHFAGHRASSIGLAISRELSLNQRRRLHLFFDENNSNQTSNPTPIDGNPDAISAFHTVPTMVTKITTRSPPLHEKPRSDNDALARRSSIEANATTWWKGYVVKL